MTESTLRRIIREELVREREIGSVYGDVTVKVQVDLTQHADERRFRHGNEAEITEDEIVALVENSTGRIIDYIISDRLDVGETVVLRHQGRNLNVVGALEQGPRPDVLELTVITVMRKEDFKPKPQDTVINIR